MTDTSRTVDDLADGEALDQMAEYAESVALRPLETRSAELVDVRGPERIVEIIAAPYDVDAPIQRNGRWLVESFAPDAFRGIEQRPNRVKVNRDHDVARTCGRAVALHPSRAEGLVAELRISKTALGDETLELAADGVLDASVGFRPWHQGGEIWSENRTRRRVARAFLGHIALVPDPAYEGANVLDVRSQLAGATMLGNAAADLGSAFGQAGVRFGELAPEVVAAVTAVSETPNKDQLLATLRELGYSPRST